MSASAQPGERLVELLRARGKTLSPLLIVTHNHPDPDAMASAFAVQYLGRKLTGLRSRIVYGGIVGRAENQAMAQVLKIPLHPVRKEDFAHHKSIALVDTQPAFKNHCLPARRGADLVVDHHRAGRRPRSGEFLVDETSGATATILTEALLDSGVSIPPRLATALVYAIGSETQTLAAEAGGRDIQAYVALFPRCDLRRLARIQNPERHSSFFLTLARALRQTFVYEEVMGVHLGITLSSDVVAQIADLLLTHEGIRWVICTGRFGGRLVISLRTKNSRPLADHVLLGLVTRKGGAGGHGKIAGGSIPVGDDAPDHRWEEEETALTMRFLRRLGHRDAIEFHYPFAKA